MKKLNITHDRSGKIDLTKKELKQLLGGSDPWNLNTTSGCECTFYNAPTVTNTNEESGCSCQCIY